MPGMMPSPPQAPQAGPGPSPQQGAQGPSPQSAQGPHQQQQPQMSAQQSLVMIHTGFNNLGKLLASAGPNVLSPQDKQLFNDAVNSFQAMVQHLGQSEAKQMPPGAQPAPKGASPMMPQHANSGAKATY